jgi:hypothetical protein
MASTMEFDIEINNVPVGRKWFSSGDEVQGAVVLVMSKSTAITALTISLYDWHPSTKIKDSLTDNIYRKVSALFHLPTCSGGRVTFRRTASNNRGQGSLTSDTENEIDRVVLF